MTREEAIPILRQIAGSYGDVKKYHDAMWMAIEALKERKTGKWILSDDQQKEDIENGNYQYFCSNCLYSDIHAKTVTVPFCWHCGAKMEV